MKARQQSVVAIRHFEIPVLNFSVTNYIDLIDWQTVQVSPPPILSGIPDDELMKLITEESDSFLDYKKYPCHTQVVERCIKIVTEASASVCGAENRDGFVKVKLLSRNKMPHSDTKNHYIN